MNAPPAWDAALNILAARVAGIVPHHRGARLQAAVLFRPATNLDEEFELGPLRAAFADVWETRFKAPVPIQALQQALLPPVPIGTVLQFSRFAYAGDHDELSGGLVELFNHLAERVQQAGQWQQRPLFPKEELAGHRETTPAMAGRTVSSLSTLVLEGVTFPTIYADPPWQYDNEAARGAAAKHYRTMTVEAICAEPVRKLAAKNAHLHLWTTNGFLREAISVIEAWGFRFKSSLVWVKDGIGTGNYWRVSHEFLLLSVRGQLPFRDQSVGSWLRAPRTEHSRKPGSVRCLVERVSPGPYLELFGREELPNSAWTVFGDQIERRLF